MKLSQPVQTNIRALSGSLIFQPKINGIRSVWSGDNLQTRNGRDITCLPHIVDEIKAKGLAHFPFDGELFAESIPFQDLNGLIRRKKPGPEHLKINYYVFDLISAAPQNIRLAELENLPTLEHVKIVPSKTGNPETVYNEFLAAGYEGLIAREASARYGFGIWKIKPVFDAEYLVVKADVNGFICELESGERFRIERYDHGLKPGDLATIEYNSKTLAGIPVHGRLKSGRYDLPETTEAPARSEARPRQDTKSKQAGKPGDGSSVLFFIGCFIIQAVLFFPLVLLGALISMMFPKR